MDYVYKVKDGQGRVTESVARAESAAVLRTRLTARGMDVIDIKEKGGLTGQNLSRAWETVVDMSTRVTLKDMVIFSRQFSAMISAGVAMLRT
ncbi:MAG: type II secretion system F family protein, partial [Candidatus Obscuribacterales bacterium]